MFAYGLMYNQVYYLPTTRYVTGITRNRPRLIILATVPHKIVWIAWLKSRCPFPILFYVREFSFCIAYIWRFDYLAYCARHKVIICDPLVPVIATINCTFLRTFIVCYIYVCVFHQRSFLAAGC